MKETLALVLVIWFLLGTVVAVCEESFDEDFADEFGDSSDPCGGGPGSGGAPGDPTPCGGGPGDGGAPG